MGKRRKKNRDLGPRRKRMRRPARLQAAVQWGSGYGGKNIVRGYARWFGVDLVCAIVELRMLGIAIDTEYEQQVRRTIAARADARARRRAAKLDRWIENAISAKTLAEVPAARGVSAADRGARRSRSDRAPRPA